MRRGGFKFSRMIEFKCGVILGSESQWEEY